MVRVGAHDAFEMQYRSKLKALLALHGLLPEYPDDRASLDLGLHLYERPLADDPVVSQVRVWIQAKGIRTETLEAFDPQDQSDVAVRGLSLDHVRFWYGSPEPVYLAVYIEEADAFLAEDARELVDRVGGFEMLARKADEGQKEMTLRIRATSTLEEALQRMPRHRSMRVDGPAFRGRPLGHRYDPLRSEMEPLAAADFESLVDALLEAYEFRKSREVRLQEALDDDVGRVFAMVGALHLTYEWVSPQFTEFGYDRGSSFRIEGSPEHAQGDVFVVVHSEPLRSPRPTAATRELVEGIRDLGIKTALVFFNAPEPTDDSPFGGWRATLDPLAHVPQGLGSLSFNVLTTTLVYLEFVDRLRWRFVNFLRLRGYRRTRSTRPTEVVAIKRKIMSAGTADPGPSLFGALQDEMGVTCAVNHHGVTGPNRSVEQTSTSDAPPSPSGGTFEPFRTVRLRGLRAVKREQPADRLVNDFEGLGQALLSHVIVGLYRVLVAVVDDPSGPVVNHAVAQLCMCGQCLEPRNVVWVRTVKS